MGTNDVRKLIFNKKYLWKTIMQSLQSDSAKIQEMLEIQKWMIRVSIELL